MTMRARRREKKIVWTFHASRCRRWCVICASRALSFPPCFVWIIHKWYLPEAGLGPIKIVLHVMSRGRVRVKRSWQAFLVSSEWGNSSSVYAMSTVPVTTVIDWQSLLSMSQLPVVMSNKTTALRRPTLHWDFAFSFSSSYLFGNFKISCQKVYCLVFRMRLSLHILWLMGILFSFLFFRNPACEFLLILT